MPSYQIEVDGAKYRVDSPTALSDVQVWQAVQAEHTKPAAAPTPSYSPAPDYSPASDMSPLGKMAVGAGAAVDRAGRGIGKLLGVDTSEGDANAKLYEKYHPGGWGTAGEVAGDVAMTALPAGAIGRAGGAVGSMFPRASGALANAATQIGANAGMSAAMAPESRGMAAAAGGAGAGLGMALQRAVGGLVKPMMTDDAKALMAKGVQLTPGQSMGDWANRAEQQLTSLPLAGHFIGQGRQRATNEAFKSMADDVVRDLPGLLPPQASTGTAVALRQNNALVPGGALPRAAAAGGAPMPQTGRAAVRAADAGNDTMITMRDAIGEVYDNALSTVPHVPLDATALLQRAVRATHASAMSEASKEQVLKYVSNNVLDRVPGAAPGATQDLSGEAVKAMESGLRKEATAYLYSGDAEHRAIGAALLDVHQGLREMLDSALSASHPEAARAMKRADQAWRAFLPLDRASASMGAQSAGGVPQPRMLLSALKALDKTQNDNALRRAMARGGSDTPYGQLIDNMQQQSRVFGNTVADSGTAGRNGMMAALASGGAALAGHGLPLAGLAATTGLAAAAYSRLGSRLLTQGMAPETVQRFVTWAAQKGVPEDVLTAQLPNMLAAFQRERQ